MTHYNKAEGYYVVKWDGHPNELQEDTDGIKAGYVVCNDTSINPIQRAHHWYTPRTTKTIVRAQNVLTDNIDFHRTSSSIKLPNTCDNWETAQKGTMEFPNRLHKGLLDDILHRGALEFI